MTKDKSDLGRKERTGRLCFMLSQLRDDLDEFVTGLKTESITCDVAVTGIKAQLQWLLSQLDQSA